MILTATILILVAGGWLALAAWLSSRLGLTMRQAFFYAPLKLVNRIGDGEAKALRQASPPIIYAVRHQSRIEPALALSLLPQETLHILDQESAKAAWLEPWRALARTIGFNAEHLFVNRRLVRHLKGKGRLAVYLPADIKPDTKAFRLYRAIARIAESSGAAVVPVHFERTTAGPLPRLTLRTLPPLTIAQLAERSSAPGKSQALFNRIEEARLKAAA